MYSVGQRNETPLNASVLLGVTPRAEALPLSYAQQRLWFVAQTEGASEAYHIPLALGLTGDLNRPALQRALDRLVWRHEALRTNFQRVNEQTVQRIAPPEIGLALQQHDLRGHTEGLLELERRMAEEARAPFDLEHGPLIRGQLLQLAEQEHMLAITVHHIVSDGWSIGVLGKELSALYGAYCAGQEDPLPPPAIQYADFAVWQREWLSGSVLARQSAYWQRALEGAPALLELPTDRPRPVQQEYAGDVVPVELDAELTGGLKALSQRHAATLYMTILAGWAAVLSRLSGQSEVVIGTPVANRTRTELEGLIGFFVNTQAVRVGVSGTAAELLERVKGQALDAQEHQDLPFEQVVELVKAPRSLSHTPIFQVMLAWQNNQETSLDLPGLIVSPAKLAYNAVKFDLELELNEVGNRIVGGLRYATALFERSTIERHVGYLRKVLQAMVADERQAVDQIDLLPAEERTCLLLDWNQTPAQPLPNTCIHELFEAQVSRNPDAIAVVYESQTLTYSELNRQANRLAHHLINLGVKPDTPVALCVDRSLQMVVGILAILKAGGAYLPLDPAYPADRLAYMLHDASPAVVLTSTSRAVLNPGSIPVLDLQADAPVWAQQPESNPDRQGLQLQVRHLAYIIYTSGSTGAPKGVMVEHGNVVRLLTATEPWFHFTSSDVWTLFHSYAFDFSVWELWGALAYGGRLVVVPQQTTRSPQEFYELLCREQVTVLNQTPSAFRQLLAAQQESPQEHQLRWVIFGGEALEVSQLKPWYRQPRNQHTRLVNMYGITETTVHVTYRELTEADTQRMGPSPIGVRIPDLRIYILDEQRRPVPVGVAGELYVGGGGVARGYRNRAELTAARFLADPFCGEAGARMYKTGDVGRWLANGEMEYLGRNDQQVKMRGFRIELGEIEARLQEHASVREAAVVAREDQPGDQRLVAYVTAVSGQAVEVESLRRWLGSVLPEYMVPAAYVQMERLPLTANGKLDRKSLPAPDADAYLTREYEAPVGEVEQKLAAIWAEVLQVKRVGRHDNFFELGGHSLLILRLLTLLAEAGIDATVTDLFNYSTISSLTASLAKTTVRMQNRGAILVRGGTQRPLFLAHDGYGSELYFSALARYLPDNLPVYGLPAVPITETQLDTVSAMAARMVKLIQQVQPEGPYRVAGWSFGGLLAYEITQQLLERGNEVQFLALIDTLYPPAYSPEEYPEEISEGIGRNFCSSQFQPGGAGAGPHKFERQDTIDDLAAYYRDLNTLPHYFRYLSPEEVRVHCHYLNVHTRAMYHYCAKRPSIPVHLIVAAEPPSHFPTVSPSLGWETCVPAHQLMIRSVPGNHESMMRSPHITVLGQQLCQMLAAAEPGDLLSQPQLSNRAGMSHCD